MPKHLKLPNTPGPLRDLAEAVNAAHTIDPGNLGSCDLSNRNIRLQTQEIHRYGLFQILEDWTINVSTSSSGNECVPSDWYYALACPVRYYSGPKSWLKLDRPFGVSNRVLLWHQAGYPPETATDQRSPSKHDFMPIAGVGDWVWAYQNPDSALWEVVQLYETIWRFELDGSLALGSSALAYLLLKDRTGSSSSGGGGSGGSIRKTQIKFTVHDALEIFTGEKGQRGYAKRMADCCEWEIIQLQCEAPSSSSSSSSGV